MFDIGYWILDIGYWMSDVGCWMLDVPSPLSLNSPRHLPLYVGMKSLRVLASVGTLAASVFVLAGCQKTTSAADVAAGPVLSLSEPTAAQPKLPTVKLYVGPEQMDAELCRTPIQIQTGMMFRKTMGTNDGMVFNLSFPQQAGFWMKNCYVPLSVAYLNSEGVIEEIHPLQVQDTNTVLSTATDIRFALETPQGWFDWHHVTTGMVVRTERGSLLETFQKQ
jgi:uncharacterized membrane protein (UPF0127 family)